MICDWINRHLPWLVKTIGNMSLKGQITLAAVVLFVVVAGWTLIKNCAFIAALLSDDEPYDAGWMEYDAWFDTRPERKR